ncbi:MAG TPA: YciI family protein [Terriglobales bacterium]
MRYMLLIYTQAAPASQEEMEQVKQAHREVMEETIRKGIFQGAEPLAPTPTATTVRVTDGKVLTTDGPFAETKEQLAGYYILDCKDIDEAVGYAARIPSACGGKSGCIEIRALPGLPSRESVTKQKPEAVLAQ